MPLGAGALYFPFSRNEKCTLLTKGLTRQSNKAIPNNDKIRVVNGEFVA